MTGKNERLTALMQARLLDLGMKTWRDLSVKAGISYETLRALRAGGNPSDGTVHALEKALQWEPGSMLGILAGGEPETVKPGPSEPHTARELKEILDADPELAEAVHNLVRIAQRTRSGQPPEEEQQRPRRDRDTG